MLRNETFPKRDFFLPRVDKDTDEELFKGYIISKGIKVVDMSMVSNKNAKYNIINWQFA